MNSQGLKTSERGVSEIYGTFLIISLVLITALLIVGTGTFVVSQLTQETTDELSQDTMLEMDDRLDGITEDEISDSTVFEFPSGSGDQIDSMEDEGVANVTVEVDEDYKDIIEADDDLNDDLEEGDYYEEEGVFNITIDMGTIVHETDDGTITGYQGGAVWERQPSGYVEPRTMPPLAFEDTAIDLSLISLDGIDDISEGQELTAQQNIDATGDEDIATAIEQMQNVTTQGVNAPVNITLDIESSLFAYGWADYAENSLGDEPYDIDPSPEAEGFEDFGDEVTIEFGQFGEGFGDSEFEDPVVYSGVTEAAPVEHAPETDNRPNEISHGDDPGEIIIEEIAGNPPAANPQYWVMIYDTREGHWWYQGHGPSAESWVNVANGTKVYDIEEIHSDFEFDLDEPDEATYSLEEDTPILVLSNENAGPQQPDWDDREDAEYLINQNGTDVMSGISNPEALNVTTETPDFELSIDAADVTVEGEEFEGEYPSDPQELEAGDEVNIEEIDIEALWSESPGGPGVDGTDIDLVLGAFDGDDEPLGFLEFDSEAYTAGDVEDQLSSNNEYFEFENQYDDLTWEVPQSGEAAGLFVTAVWSDGLDTTALDDTAFEIVDQDTPEFEFENADEFFVDNEYVVGEEIYPKHPDYPDVDSDDGLVVYNLDQDISGEATVTLLLEDEDGENPIPVGQHTTDEIDADSTSTIDMDDVKDGLHWTGAQGEYQFNLTVGTVGADDDSNVGAFEVEDQTGEVTIEEITMPEEGETFDEGDTVEVQADIAEYQGEESTIVPLTVDGNLVSGVEIEPGDEEIVFDGDSAWQIPFLFTGDDEDVETTIAVQGANEESVDVVIEEEVIEGVQPDFNITELTFPDGEVVNEDEEFTVEANITNDGDEAIAPVSLFVPEPEGTQEDGDSSSVGGEDMQLTDVTTENIGAGYEIIELTWEAPTGLDPTENYELNVTTDGDYETKSFEVEPRVVIEDFYVEASEPVDSPTDVVLELDYTGEGSEDADVTLVGTDRVPIIEDETVEVSEDGETITRTLNPQSPSGYLTATVDDGVDEEVAEEQVTVERDGPQCNTVDYSYNEEEEAYEINHIDQLQCINDHGLDEDYVVVHDIDATGTEYWNDGKGFEPIGPEGHEAVDGDWENPPFDTFKGNFDGNGNLVSGLYIERPNERFVGLFGSTAIPHEENELGFSIDPGVGSTIENIRLSDVHVVGQAEVGGLVGQAGGTIINARSEGYVEAKEQLVGGLIGLGAHADIDNRIVAEGTVVGDEVPNRYLGGLDETAEGNAKGIGGLIGRAAWETEIARGYAQVEVEGPTNVGGIMGSSSLVDSEFEEMYSASTVTATHPGADGGSIVGIVQSDGDEFENDMYYDRDLESQEWGEAERTVQECGWVGNNWECWNELENMNIDEVEQTDWNEKTTDAMTGVDASGNLTNLEFEDGPWVAVPDDYPRFAWELAAEGTVEVEINEDDSDNVVQETEPLTIDATVTGEIESSDPGEQTRTIVLFDPDENPVGSTTVTLSELDVGEEPSYANGAVKDVELEWQTLRGDATDGIEDVYVQVFEEGELLDPEQFYVDSMPVEVEEIDDPESEFTIDNMIIEAEDGEPVEQGEDSLWITADITHEWEYIAVDGSDEDDTLEFESPVFLTIDDIPVAETTVSNEVGEPDGLDELDPITFDDVTVPTQIDIPEGEEEAVDVSVLTPDDDEMEELLVEGTDDEVGDNPFEIDIEAIEATGAAEPENIVDEDEGVFEDDITVTEPVELELTVENTEDAEVSQNIILTDQDGTPLSIQTETLEDGEVKTVVVDDIVADADVEELRVETDGGTDTEDTEDVYIEELDEGNFGIEIESVEYDLDGEDETFDEPTEFTVGVSDSDELDDLEITATVRFEEEPQDELEVFLEAQDSVVATAETDEEEFEIEWKLEDRGTPAFDTPLELTAFVALESTDEDYAVEILIPDDAPEFGFGDDSGPVDIDLDEIVIS